MSDRLRVIDMETFPSRTTHEADRVELYMDGESGTWRLFVNERGNSDFSLETLTAFRDALTSVLADIERDPEGFNAETRRAWTDDE